MTVGKLRDEFSAAAVASLVETANGEAKLALLIHHRGPITSIDLSHSCNYRIGPAITRGMRVWCDR